MTQSQTPEKEATLHTDGQHRQGVTLYKVMRMYRDDEYGTEIIETGLTREEAMAHCHDPETSSSTATSAEALARTEERGPWFDGFDEE